VVSFILSSNGKTGLAFLQFEYLGTLEVGIKGAESVPARHVEENLL
jgi:hypothetical protein